MISTFEQVAGRPGVSLADIESAAREYDASAAALEESIAALESDLEAVKQKHLAGLKRQAGAVARREAELYNLVEAGPELFKRPRTMVFHGIKAGYTKSEGCLVWDCDDETLLERIKTLFPQTWRKYVHVKESPNKDALKELAGSVDGKTLGIKLDGAGDVIVLKRVAGDVAKLINKLISKLVEAMVGGK